MACESLAKPTPLPSADVTGRDLGVSAAENRAAAKQANDRLRATARCQADQRQRFGAGR